MQRTGGLTEQHPRLADLRLETFDFSSQLRIGIVEAMGGSDLRIVLLTMQLVGMSLLVFLHTLLLLLLKEQQLLEALLLFLLLQL